VFGIVERESGRLHATHLPGRSRLNSWTTNQQIDAVVDPAAKIMTDESRLYASLERRGFKHEIVIHRDVHTQTIDSFWGLLKRGVVGTYHQISIKHLDRYVTEFSYRWNNRQNQELFKITVACLVYGIPLPYAKLIARTSEQAGARDFFGRAVLVILRDTSAFGSGDVVNNFRTTPSNCSRFTFIFSP
jgi:hypothetical protein